MSESSQNSTQILLDGKNGSPNSKQHQEGPSRMYVRFKGRWVGMVKSVHTRTGWVGKGQSVRTMAYHASPFVDFWGQINSSNLSLSMQA